MTDKYFNMADSIVRQYAQRDCAETETWILRCHYGTFRGNSPQSIRAKLAPVIREAFAQPPIVIDLT